MIPFFLKGLNILLFIFLLLVGISIQTSLLSGGPVIWVQPCFPALIVSWAAIKRPFEQGGIMTLCVGFAAQMHTSAPSGFLGLSLVFIFCHGYTLSKMFFLQSRKLFSLLTGLHFIIYRLSIWALVWVFYSKTTDPLHLAKECAFGAAATALVAMLVFPLFEKLDEVTLQTEQVTG
jgi:hypothetical protein